MILIMDASALIAYLEDEPGADVVDALLLDPAAKCFVHAVNLCEVYYGFRREYGEMPALMALEALSKCGIQVREDMDEAFWREAGRIKADFRRISLADCFCAALAARVGGQAVTADHHEFDALAASGACSVRFIR